jgi:hypothetical protein
MQCFAFVVNFVFAAYLFDTLSSSLAALFRSGLLLKREAIMPA